MAILAQTLTVTTTPVMVSPSDRDGQPGCRVVLRTSGSTFAAGDEMVVAPNRVEFSDTDPLPEIHLTGDDELWLAAASGSVTVEVIESGI